MSGDNSLPPPGVSPIGLYLKKSDTSCSPPEICTTSEEVPLLAEVVRPPRHGGDVPIHSSCRLDPVSFELESPFLERFNQCVRNIFGIVD